MGWSGPRRDLLQHVFEIQLNPCSVTRGSTVDESIIDDLQVARANKAKNGSRREHDGICAKCHNFRTTQRERLAGENLLLTIDIVFSFSARMLAVFKITIHRKNITGNRKESASSLSPQNHIGKRLKSSSIRMITQENPPRSECPILYIKAALDLRGSR